MFEFLGRNCRRYLFLNVDVLFFKIEKYLLRYLFEYKKVRFLDYKYDLTAFLYEKRYFFFKKRDLFSLLKLFFVFFLNIP